MGAQTLPDGYIWLGDAFELAWEAIEDGKRLALAAERQVPDPKFSEAMGGGNWMQCDPAASQERDESRRRVEKRMRTALATGDIRAFIRDPKTGEPGELADREKWREKVSFGVPGLATKLHHLTCPGPETDGRRVFLKESELQGLIRVLAGLTEAAPAKKPRLRRRTKVEAAKEAISALWPNGFVAGVSAKTRNASINKWLQDNGRDRVSDGVICIARRLTH